MGRLIAKLPLPEVPLGGFAKGRMAGIWGRIGLIVWLPNAFDL